MAKIETTLYKLNDGRELTFRALEPGDAATHLAFLAKIAEESTNTMRYVGMEFESIVATAERFRQSLADRHSLLLGAFDGDRVVAYLRFHPASSGHPWVAHLAQFGMMVLKEFWGQGVGRKLLHLQDLFALSLGITRIEAMVRTQNEAGIKLYLRNGYRIEGTRANAALINGEMQDEYFIAKMLNDPLANWKPAPFETDRLLLRPIEISDAPAIFAYAKNPIVSDHTTWEPHQSIDETLGYIKDYVFPLYAKGTPEPYGIALKTDPSKIIGTVGAFWISRPAKAMELAYALSDRYWGKGYMPEAARAVMEKCISDYGLKRVQARCIDVNVQSSAVMQKIGMQYEGTLRSSLYRRGQFWNMSYYALITD